MKNLTINRIAAVNIRQHKKRYIVMLISVTLAMIFSSGTVFFISSFKTSLNEIKMTALGSQDAVVIGISEDEAHQLKDRGIVSEYGIARLTGKIYNGTVGVEKGVCTAYYDDKSFELAHRRLSEGRFPEAPGEIAVERDALLRMRLTDIAVGDSFTVKMFVRNGKQYLETPVDVTYKLTGILKDQRVFYENSAGSEFIDGFPAALITEADGILPGGKADNVVYAEFFGKNIAENSMAMNDFLRNSKQDTLPQAMITAWMSTSQIEGYQSVMYNSVITVVLTAVLIAASCIGIINTFSTNLRDRKKQIGMLRAIGATKRQIINVFGREAFIISLLSAPVSIVISYFGVKTAIGLMGDDFVFEPKLYVLLLCAAAGVVCVMCTALIPLANISRISPMITIRNTEYNRKLKRKKIHTVKQYAVPRLLAKRENTFGKARLITVSLLLAVAILLSSIGFSWVIDSTEQYDRPYDYYITNMTWGTYYGYANNKNEPKLITNGMYSEIASSSYIGRVTSSERRTVNWLIDEPTQMQFAELAKEAMTFTYCGSDALPEITRENYKDIAFAKDGLSLKSGKSSHADSVFSVDESEYPSPLEQLSKRFDYNCYVLPCEIFCEDRSVIEGLTDDMILEGSINIDKLNSGEEILLIMPEAVSFAARVYDPGESDQYAFINFFTTVDTEKEMQRDKNRYRNGETEVFLDSFNYDVHAGETADLSLLFCNNIPGDEREDDLFAQTEEHRKTVKIGAVIKGGGQITNTMHSWGIDFLTTQAGYESFGVSSLPTSIFADLKVNADDSTDEAVCAMLDMLCSGANVYYDSTYFLNRDIASTRATLLTALSAIILLIFSICIAIINNSMSARIRESKRQIGTLRAVGASFSELAGSFTAQLLTMFGYGTVTGFASFGIFYLTVVIVARLKNEAPQISFYVWPAVLLTAISFVICGINMRVKIREQMKNSIVDNIREL